MMKQSLQIQCINVFIHGNEDMIKQTTCMYQWRMAKCHIKEVNIVTYKSYWPCHRHLTNVNNENESMF